VSKINQFMVVKFESSIMLTLSPSLLLYATNKLIPDPVAFDKGPEVVPLGNQAYQ
jgi:hypothetical protein